MDTKRSRRLGRGRRGRLAAGSVGVAVAQFALPGVLAVLLLGFFGVQVFRDTGTREAIRDAKQVTRLAGDGIVAPYLTPQVLAGRPRALATLDRVVRQRVLSDPVVRVKIWDASGRVVYSDARSLIGRRYHLDEDDLAALRRGAADAGVSDLTRPENRIDRRFKKLLEVYQGVRATNGTPLLFEVYQRFSSVSASGDRLWRAFAPALIGGLLLLELIQIPLAWSLARRLRQGQREREALLRRAIEASDTERRRIAANLHDGVVQNLAGVAYGLAAAAEEVNGGPGDGSASTTLGDAAEQTRQSIRALRTLLVEIYPPSLHRAGLSAALADLLAPVSARTELDVPPDLRLPERAEELLFRTAQEAVRNAEAHADPSLIEVVARVDGGVATLEVTDDGRGFDAGSDQVRHGHFGLRMLGDLARDAGGGFDVESQPGRGTRVRIEVPVE